MEDNLIDGFEAPKTSGRPTFLTILCILTWAGCALVIGIYGYTYTIFSSMLNNWNGPLPDVFNWLLWNMVVSCIGALVCLLGSIAMWKLRKWGFYVYLVGQIVPMVLTVYVTLIMSGMRASITELATLAIWVVIPVGFIVMYAVHLKHLR